MIEIEHHVPGPERPDVLTIQRPDGSRDNYPHAGANAYERMVTAFVAEAAGDLAPGLEPHRLDPPRPPPRSPPRRVITGSDEESGPFAGLKLTQNRRRSAS